MDLNKTKKAVERLIDVLTSEDNHSRVAEELEMFEFQHNKTFREVVYNMAWPAESCESDLAVAYKARCRKYPGWCVYDIASYSDGDVVVCSVLDYLHYFLEGLEGASEYSSSSDSDEDDYEENA